MSIGNSSSHLFIHSTIHSFNKHRSDKHTGLVSSRAVELFQGHNCVFNVTESGEESSVDNPPKLFFGVFLSLDKVNLKLCEVGDQNDGKRKSISVKTPFIRPLIHSGNMHWTMTLPGSAPEEVELHEMLLGEAARTPGLGDTEKMREF